MMSYLSAFGTSVSYAAQIVSSGSLTPSSIAASDIPEEKLNLEGFTSALRIAMFPFAQNARVKVEKYAFNFDFPEPVLGIDTTAIKRTLMNLAWKDESGIGSKNLVKVKRVANIMLELFPPVPAQIDKPKADITKIYEFFIHGLECLAQKYFSKETLRIMKKINEIPDIATFDYDPLTDAPLSEEKAARAIQETINLVRHYLWQQKAPLNNLSSIQQKIQESYTPRLISQFVNGLELLRDTQGSTPIATQWVCRYEFLSLEILVSGCLARFKQIRADVSTVEPSNKKSNPDLNPSHKIPTEISQAERTHHAVSPREVQKTLLDPAQSSGQDTRKSPKSNYANESVLSPDLTTSVLGSYPPITEKPSKNSAVAKTKSRRQQAYESSSSSS